MLLTSKQLLIIAFLLKILMKTLVFEHVERTGYVLLLCMRCIAESIQGGGVMGLPPFTTNMYVVIMRI